MSRLQAAVQALEAVLAAYLIITALKPPEPPCHA